MSLVELYNCGIAEMLSLGPRGSTLVWADSQQTLSWNFSLLAELLKGCEPADSNFPQLQTILL